MILRDTLIIILPTGVLPIRILFPPVHHTFITFFEHPFKKLIIFVVFTDEVKLKYLRGREQDIDISKDRSLEKRAAEGEKPYWEDE